MAAGVAGGLTTKASLEQVIAKVHHAVHGMSIADKHSQDLLAGGTDYYDSPTILRMKQSDDVADRIEFYRGRD